MSLKKAEMIGGHRYRFTLEKGGFSDVVCRGDANFEAERQGVKRTFADLKEAIGGPYVDMKDLGLA
jgi:hypothetical protein